MVERYDAAFRCRDVGCFTGIMAWVGIPGLQRIPAVSFTPAEIAILVPGDGLKEICLF